MKCDICKKYTLVKTKKNATVIFYSKDDPDPARVFFRCQEHYNMVAYKNEYEVLTPKEYDIFQVMKS
jgi:predicted ATPase